MQNAPPPFERVFLHPRAHVEIKVSVSPNQTISSHTLGSIVIDSSNSSYS